MSTEQPHPEVAANHNAHTIQERIGSAMIVLGGVGLFVGPEFETGHPLEQHLTRLTSVCVALAGAGMRFIKRDRADHDQNTRTTYRSHKSSDERYGDRI